MIQQICNNIGGDAFDTYMYESIQIDRLTNEKQNLESIGVSVHLQCAKKKSTSVNKFSFKESFFFWLIS